jgi:dihydrofolate reductase
MAAARIGLKNLCPWSFGNANSYFGNYTTDTTGVILGWQTAYNAMVGKTITAGGYYPDGREWLQFADGSSYTV